MRHLILVLMLIVLVIPAGAIGIDLPQIDPGAGLWLDFETGVKSVVFTATTPVAKWDSIRFNGGITLPSDLERLDFGFVATAKLSGRFELGIGTRDWFQKPGMLLRYSF